MPKPIFLLGLASECCVAFSALDGIGECFEIYVFEDATSALGGEQIEAMLEKQQDAEVRFITTSDVIV